MQFTVPKFILYKTKVFGPFEFKQFILIGMIGAVLFVIYAVLSLYVFVLIAMLLGGGTLALIFIKVEGKSIPTFLENFLMFKARPKFYLWKTSLGPPKKYLLKKELPPKVEEETPSLKLKIAGQSLIKKLSAEIELKTK